MQKGVNMKLSQLLHKMERDARIIVEDTSLPIDRMRVYEGEVRRIKRDAEINSFYVEHVLVVGNVLVVLAGKPNRKEKRNGKND